MTSFQTVAHAKWTLLMESANQVCLIDRGASIDIPPTQRSQLTFASFLYYQYQLHELLVCSCYSDPNAKSNYPLWPITQSKLTTSNTKGQCDFSWIDDAAQLHWKCAMWQFFSYILKEYITEYILEYGIFSIQSSIPFSKGFAQAWFQHTTTMIPHRVIHTDTDWYCWACTKQSVLIVGLLNTQYAPYSWVRVCEYANEWQAGSCT